MNRLNAFSTTATPVFRDLGEAAPSLARATKALGPFSQAGTPAFTSLGTAAEKAGPDLVASDPVIRQVRGLARVRQDGDQEPRQAARQPAQDGRLSST